MKNRKAGYDEKMSMPAEHIEELKPVLYILAIIPGLLLLRFLVFMILPKSILKKYFTGKQGYKKADALKKKKRAFDD